MEGKGGVWRVVLVLWAVAGLQALDNGLGKTPGMGWNSWNQLYCDISAQTVEDAAAAIVELGLDKLGYTYVNMDDCWQISRDEAGKIVPDPDRFPNGIKPVSDYVHSLGLQFGIYTDRGNLTCQERPGSKNYEQIDAETYAEWGVDYVKEDSCHATQFHQAAFEQYETMRDALNSTGRPIYFSLCGWFDWYAPTGSTMGNSWRISQDCTNWDTTLLAAETNEPLAQYAGPGGWNDPDMLISSNEASAFYLTQDRSRTMFSLWSIMAAPLLIGSNIQNLTDWDLETYSNAEVIAVDQDPLGIQGYRLSGGKLVSGLPKPPGTEKNGGKAQHSSLRKGLTLEVEPSGLDSVDFPLPGNRNFDTTNVWGRPLQGGSWALLFLNNGEKAAEVTCNATCFEQMNFGTPQARVRDLWLHSDVGTITISDTKSFSVMVDPLGASKMFRLDPVPDSLRNNFR